MSHYTRLLLLRHGETQANRELRYIGSGTDNELSEQGFRQAELLATALANLPVRAVYSSPLRRTYQTALPIAASHKLKVQELQELREMHFGSWEGLTRAEVAARSEQDALHLQDWHRDPLTAPPGGESMGMVQQRVQAVVERLAQIHEQQTIVLVTHVVPIKALLCAALAAPLSTTFSLFLDPATISVVDWRQPYPIVRLFNSHAHLGWESARWMQL